MENRTRQWAHIMLDKQQRDVHIESKKRTIDRTMQFWMRCMSIYASYKVCQIRVQFVSDKQEQDRIWEEQHESAAEKVYALCTDLGGFFLKSAQVLAKPDLVPAAWVKKLVVLCDDAPPTPFETVQGIVEAELGNPINALFERFDQKPLGCASIAQVHRARLKGRSTDVAVKVQHPGAEELMMTDISNQKTFGAFLQRFDVKFDLVSAVDELEQQVHHEFDFLREAKSMDRIAVTLSKENRGSPPIQVPRPVPGFVTRKVLVMDFVEGIPILRIADEMIKRGINPHGSVANHAKRSILKDITAAYGQMILRDGFFQADPHPGNILVKSNGKVALLDYGQVKELPNELRLAFARLILGMSSHDPKRIELAFGDLGIEISKLSMIGEGSIKDLATIMFDTKLPGGLTVVNPFADDSLLKQISVPKFPRDLFFLLRTIHILRGISMGMGISYSVADEWKKLADEALKAANQISTGSQNGKGQAKIRSSEQQQSTPWRRAIKQQQKKQHQWRREVPVL
ncbi:uncharacterized protein LOC9654680 [Selaginella moellendorffii]|uniref:uncharacterized protein LOC9654680 n=1 Tax=Selaginella moellendorffii TaxID=88036 RepID=UPI000D1CE5BB|nr:uncharacterized protein LOC9654680 [Selaginella moellendorffii]|eukprot:XP_024524906.1 uncharacterized protein LOC9654680 [Selaginella moellendorffii]